MQRAELEEARQREANETALLAIGPRKKLKLSHNPTGSASHLSFNSSSNSMPLSLLSFSNPGNKQVSFSPSTAFGFPTDFLSLSLCTAAS